MDWTAFHYLLAWYSLGTVEAETMDTMEPVDMFSTSLVDYMDIVIRYGQNAQYCS